MNTFKRFCLALTIIFCLSLLQPLTLIPIGYAAEPEVDTEETVSLSVEGVPQKVEAMAGELIVKYRDDAGISEKREFRTENDVTKEAVRLDPLGKMKTENVELADDATATELKIIEKRLEADDAVEYVEPNYVISLMAEPNDPDYPKQWTLPKIRVPEAWGKGRGSQAMVVAVLDTGLDYAHPDRPANLVSGYDFVNNDSDPQDDHGHGTFVAGLIAANMDNAKGVAGICPDCSVMPVKVMDGNGMGTYADVARGIIWAADRGAKIINLSLGGYAPSQTLQEAVSYAQEKGVLILSAGGNQGVSTPLYPAVYPDVIGVSATDQNDQHWIRSNVADYINLSAPGVNVYGLGLNGSYQSQTGSSVAVANATGVAALVWSQDMGIASSPLTQKIYRYATDLGAEGEDSVFGVGRVNAKLERTRGQNIDNEESNDGQEDIINNHRNDEKNIFPPVANSDENNIGDNKEQNNETFGHNLKISDIKIEPLIFKADESTHIITFLQNQGNTEEKNIVVNIFINENNEPLRQLIPILRAGSTMPLELAWNPKIDSNQYEKIVIKATIEGGGNELEMVNNVYLKKDKNDLVTVQYDINPPVHQYLTEQGVYYLNSIDQEAYKEVRNYISELRSGAHNEDAIGYDGLKCILFSDEYSDKIDTAWRPLRHFYRPTDKLGYFDGGISNKPTSDAICSLKVDPNTRYPNAYEWASGHVAVNQHSFQDAISEYKKGGEANKAKAYEILGYVLHLVEDMSLPEHTQLESHSDEFGGGDIGSGYEQFVKDRFSNFGESSPLSFFNILLHNGNCILNPGDDPRVCFTSAEKLKPFSYYQEKISQFTSLDQYFDSMASLSYYRNHFKGDLTKISGERGELEKIFPDLTWNENENIWEINNIGKWHNRNDGAHLDDEFWETKQFDNNSKEDPGWYYIENSYRKWDSLPVRPAKYQADWYSYALAEMKKPKDQRFKTPYSGAWVENDTNSGKILAETFAEDLIPLAVQHVAGVMDLFWRETHKNFPPPVPDLEIVVDQDFRMVETKRLFDYRYEINAKVKNGGTAQADSAVVCFDTGVYCRGSKTLTAIKPGETRSVRITFSASLLSRVAGDPLGILIVRDASPREQNLTNNAEAIPSTRLHEVNGVNLTSAEIGGVRIDPENDDIQFVIRGTEAKGGEKAIDLDLARGEQAMAFLQALAVPNYKHYVSLEIVPDGSGFKGSAKIPDPFQDTDLADAFLRADVAMKFDLFGPSNPYDDGADWVRLVMASPYWGELQAMGFDRVPYWIIAATIIPPSEQIKARQTGNEFILENVKLEIKAGWWMREPQLYLDGLGLRPAVRQDLMNRLATYKTNMESAIKTRALNFTTPALNDVSSKADPRLKRLRTFYAAVSAAQWYKDQVKKYPNLPYAELVDSENLDEIGLGHPFDWGYWNGQAYQNLGKANCSDFYGVGECEMWGGASLQNSLPVIEGALTASQEAVVSTALDQFDVARVDEMAYVYGGTLSSSMTDVEMVGLVSDVDRVAPGAPIHLGLSLLNAGSQAAQNVKIKWVDEILSPSGSKTVVPISETTIPEIVAWGEAEKALDWNLPTAIGTHRIVAVADPLDTVQELSEANNRIQVTVEVIDPHPQVEVLSPAAGSVVHPENVRFQATAFDPLAGGVIEEGSSYQWKSSLSGVLGAGKSLTMPVLTEGDHEITLTVTVASGVFSVNKFRLFIRSSNTPLPKINYPFEGAHLVRELTHRFQGEAVDNEEGMIPSGGLKWSSDLDGDLGVGSEIERGLSAGSHTITLTATDSTDQSASAEIHVVVEKGAPNLAIVSPQGGEVIAEGAEVAFRATSIDPQEGDVGSRILWSSDQEGFVGQGSNFKKVLRLGTHKITAMVVDGDGLSATEEKTVIVKNSPPVVTITSPATEAQADWGEVVIFEGSAIDPQEGIVPDGRLAWSSDRDGYIGQGARLTLNTLSAGIHNITLTATDSKNEKGTAAIHLNLYAGIPTVNILQPASGLAFVAGRSVTLEGSSTDDQDGELISASLVWTSSLDGNLGTGKQLILNGLSLGKHLIRLTATDSEGWKAVAETSITIRQPQAPQVSLLYPTQGGKFMVGKKIFFYSAASDLEDGSVLPANVKWRSSIDGDLGTGFSISRDNLSVGAHTISLVATDKDGMVGKAEIALIVTPTLPMVTILEPADGAIVRLGDVVTLKGKGADNLSWVSSQDGALGAGASVTTANLSAGTHLITLAGTDANGIEAKASIALVVKDETQLNLNTFSDGKEAVALDFSSILDHTVNILLPKEAVVTNAQARLTPQRGLLAMMQSMFAQGPIERLFAALVETESVQAQATSAASDDTGILAEVNNSEVQSVVITNDQGGMADTTVSEVMEADDFDVNILSKNIKFIPQEGELLRGPNPIASEVGVLSNDVQILGHGIGINPLPTFPCTPAVMKNEGYQDEKMVNWIYWRSSSAGYIGVEQFFIDEDGNELLWGPTEIPFSGGGDWCWSGGVFNYTGKYRSKIYFKDSIDSERVYYFSDDYTVHERPNVPPVLSTYLSYTNRAIHLQCSDSGQTITERTFYTNDGTGWQADTEKGIFWCPSMFQVTSWYEPGYVLKSAVLDRSSGEVFIENYPEGTTVQFYFTAKDFDGNVSQSPTDSFTEPDNDTAGPVISNITITEGDESNGDALIDETEKVKISFKAEDAVSGVKEATVAIDGAPQTAVLVGGLWVAQADPLPTGDHTLTITATDNDNSAATSAATQTFKVERRAILVNPSLDAGDDGTLDWQVVGEMTEPQVTGSFADALNAYLQSRPAGADGKVSVPLHFHADSGNVMRVDQLNVAYRIWDTLPPVITDLAAVPSSPKADDAVTIRAKVEDNVGVREVTVSLGSGSPVAMVDDGTGLYLAQITATSAGEYQLMAKAVDVSGLESKASIPLSVTFAGSELFVESVNFEPSEPLLAGQTVEAVVVIRNAGETDANTNVRTTDREVKMKTLSIPAGKTAGFKAIFLLPEPGAHTFVVEVDPENKVAEGDEANNTFTKTYQVAESSPPLFESIEVPENVGLGQNFEVKAGVKDNKGVKKVWTEWLGESFELVLGTDNLYAVTLKAPVAIGEKPLVFGAENTGGLTATLQEKVKVVDSKPNLRVISAGIATDPLNIMALDEPTFKIQVHNTGGTEAVVPLKMVLDGATISEADITVLPGGMLQVDRKGWRATSGVHQLRITADPENQVVETDESDNEALFDFTVAYTLVPRIENLRVPDDTLDGQNFEITANVLSDQAIQGVKMEIDGASTVMASGEASAYRYTGSLPEGVYPFMVSAISVGGLTAKLPGTIRIYPAKPDFLIKRVEMTPSSATGQASAAFVAVVGNEGVVEADVEVAVELDGQRLEVQTVHVGSRSEVALSPISWIASPGSHSLKVVADPQGKVDEIDEANNDLAYAFRVSNVTPPRIQSVTAKNVLYSGELFMVNAKVADSASLSVVAEVGGISVPMASGGDPNQFSAQLAAPVAFGPYALRVIATNADGLSALWEGTIKVVDSRPDLGLEASDVTLVPHRLAEGEKETVSAVFHNYGGTDVSDILAVFKVNGSLIGSTTVSLPKGGETRVVWDWLPTYGLKGFEISIDPDNARAESDETNNRYKISFFVNDTNPPPTPEPVASVRVQGENWSDQRAWVVRWPAVAEINLKSYQAQVDGGIWKDIGVEKEVASDFDIAGEHRVCVRAEDMAGNQSGEACVSVLLDFEAPDAPVLAGGTGNHWSSEPNQTLRWNVPLDDGSGASNYRLRINSDQIRDLAGNEERKTWEDGEYQVEVSALDDLNHQSGWSNLVRMAIDSTPPGIVDDVASSTHPNSDSWYRDGNPEFKWTAPGDLSGVQGYYFYIDEKPETVPDSRYDWLDKSELVVPMDRELKSGRYYLHLVAVDKAGNSSLETSHFSFGVDFEAPSTFLESEGGNQYRFDAYDTYSGVRKTYYSIRLLKNSQVKTLADPTLGYEDFSWQEGNRLALSGNGQYEVAFYSEDAAGNKEKIRVAQAEFRENAVGPERSTVSEGGAGHSGLDTDHENVELQARAIKGKIQGKSGYLRQVRFEKAMVTQAAGGRMTATITDQKGILTLKSNLKSPTSLTIGSDVQITADASWNRILSFPVLSPLSAIRTPTEGMRGNGWKLLKKDIGAIVRLGSPRSPFVFSRPVTLEIPVSYKRGDKVIVISSRDAKTWDFSQETTVTDGKVRILITQSGYFAVAPAVGKSLLKKLGMPTPQLNLDLRPAPNGKEMNYNIH